MIFEPARGKPAREEIFESASDGLCRAGGFDAKGTGEAAAGEEIEMDGAAGLPIGGNLEDGGAAEAAMGDEQIFAEGAIAHARGNFGGKSGEVTICGTVLLIENEGDEARSCFPDIEAELSGEGIAETGGAHPGNGKTAGGHDQCGRAEKAGGSVDGEIGGAGDPKDMAMGKDTDGGGAAFGFECGEDVIGGTVAEQLAQSFFVEGDGIFLKEGDEIGRGETGQCGFGEVRVGGKEVFGLTVQVGEIAAATTGDEDFFAAAASAFEDGDTAPAGGGVDGAHESRGATAEDECIERLSGGRKRVEGMEMCGHQDWRAAPSSARRSESGFEAPGIKVKLSSGEKRINWRPF